MTEYVAREAEVSTTTTTTSSRNRKTTTTSIGASYDNGVVNVSITPYMRGLSIYFKATGMRPNRRVWFFFDGQNITNYICDTNELCLQSNNDVSIFSPTTGGICPAVVPESIEHTANTQNTSILLTQSRQFDDDDDGSSRPRLRKLKVVGLTSSFWPGQIIRGSLSKTTATVKYLKIGGGTSLDKFFSNASSNTIILPKYTRHIANNYWGINGANTITLIPYKHYKKGAGDPVIAYIGDGVRGFDNVTRTLYLSNTHSQLANNTDPEVSILPYFPQLPETEEQNSDVANTVAWTIDGINHRTGQQGLGWYTDAEGTIDGVFIVPPGRFKIGNRLMRIIDNPINDVTDCTTRSEREFAALGLQQTKQDVTIKDTSSSTVIRESSGGNSGGGGGSSGGGGGGGSGGSGGSDYSSDSSSSGGACGISYGGSTGGLGLASGGGGSFSGGWGGGGDVGSNTFG